MKTTSLLPVLITLVPVCCPEVPAGDWPLWGGSPGRNMVSLERDLPSRFAVRSDASSSSGDSSASEQAWSVPLGRQSYGNPVVAGGRIFLGTNNDNPRNSAYPEDRGVLACFRERDGQFLWQLAVPKITRTDLFNGDRRHVGICSSPAVEGDRVYVVTNRAEVLCLDANGFRNGNDGPFRAEANYYTQPLRHEVAYGQDGPRVFFVPGKPGPLYPTDADIIWRFDMIAGVHSWPQDAANGSPLVYGDLVYVTTSNGICGRRGQRTALYPDAPNLIALDKHTGRLVAVDREQIAGRTWHGQWSSPSLGVVNGVPLVFYGGGDGWCYAFDARPVRTEGSRIGTLKTVWRFDCNPPELRFLNRKAIRYKTRGDGPSEIIATPVFHQNRVYVAVGQDPTHGRGKGCLSCIDATQTGTITDTGKIWSYSTIDRSLSTVAIHDGLLYAADYSGKLHCLDADTGEAFWVHTMRAPIWGSPLVADGKVYLGTVRGYLNVFRDAPREALIDRIRVGSAIYSTPVAANGVLYVMARSRLLAFAKSRDASQAVEEVVLPEEEPDSDLSELTGESETD